MWKLSEGDVKAAPTPSLSRLANYLSGANIVADRQTLEELICLQLGIEQHICSFTPFGWAEYECCFGCGTIRERQQ